MNFIIGDLHGDFEALHNLMSTIGTSPDESDQSGFFFAFTGDMVNKAKDKKAQVEFMDWFTRNTGGNVVSVLGNHELALISHYYGNPSVDDAVVSRMGGDWWLELPKSDRTRYVSVLKTLPVCTVLKTEKNLYGISHAHPPATLYAAPTQEDMSRMIGGKDKTVFTGKVKGVSKYFCGHVKVSQPGPQSPKSNVYYIDALGGPVMYDLHHDVFVPSDMASHEIND